MTRRDLLSASGITCGVGAAGYGVNWLRQRRIGQLTAARVGALQLMARDGSGMRLESLPGGLEGALLYAFRVGCIWCRRNRSSINALASQVKNRAACIGLILDDEWPDGDAYIFPVFRYKAELGAPLVFSQTPTTVVLSRTYQVVETLPGAYVKQVRRRIMSRFGVNLPEAG